MGAMCNGSGCGGPSAEVLQEMNNKGVYIPKQIDEHVTESWETRKNKEVDTVPSTEVKKIVQTTISSLAKLGAKNKTKFDAKRFTALITDTYPDKTEFKRKEVNKIVTVMVSKIEGKEN